MVAKKATAPLVIQEGGYEQVDIYSNSMPAITALQCITKEEHPCRKSKLLRVPGHDGITRDWKGNHLLS